jgi:carbon-monoxide dehydrogenase large subunit
VPTLTNPIGAKGAGEAGCVGALAAVVNAIVDALSPLGIDHIDMPATPERIWQAIEGRKAKSPL